MTNTPATLNKRQRINDAANEVHACLQSFLSLRRDKFTRAKLDLANFRLMQQLTDNFTKTSSITSSSKCPQLDN